MAADALPAVQKALGVCISGAGGERNLPFIYHVSTLYSRAQYGLEPTVSITKLEMWDHLYMAVRGVVEIRCHAMRYWNLSYIPHLWSGTVADFEVLLK